MAYLKIVEKIPFEKRDKFHEKLLDLILSSKNEDKMPSTLANAILYYWQRNLLKSENGLAALLEAAVLMETETLLAFLEQEAQLPDIAKSVRESSTKVSGAQ